MLASNRSTLEPKCLNRVGSATPALAVISLVVVEW
jgi:hypothetical protein